VITFIGMCVVAAVIAVGVYTILTRVKIRSYRYEVDKDGVETVVDENE